MKIGLTITNRGPGAISEARIVYIAIDGDDGKNYLRRPLPHVDLSKIAPQQTIAYSETLLSPAFPFPPQGAASTVTPTRRPGMLRFSSSRVAM